MAREWGAVRVKFWEQDEPFIVGSPITVGGKSYIESVVDGGVHWTRLMSQVGFGSVAFYEEDAWASLAAPGRVCVVEQVGSHFSGGARLLACFLVEDIEPQVRGGLNVIELRGPGLESLLNKQLAWGVIGTAVVTGTTLVTSVAGPDARSMANDSPPGVDFVILDESSSEDIDQEIRIELDNGSWFVTVITDRINIDGNMCLILRDKLPWSSFIGSPVEVRQRRIQVVNVAPFVEGATVTITTSDNGSFQTLVAGQLGTSDRVLIEAGLPEPADAGAAVTVNDTSTPTTADVSQIIAHAPGWTAYFQTGQGTAGGSFHKPRGESVFEMLSSLAERTGEFFRQRVLTTPNAPTKSIDWRRTPDSSGITLYMYDDGDYDEQAADEMILSRGAIFSLKHRRSLPLLTRVFPSAGDQQIVLSRCSQEAINYAAAHGCSITAGVGQYESDSVINEAGVSNYGYHEAQITYGDISISDAKNSAALTSACDQLLISAVQTLVTAQERKYYTIDAYIPVPVLPGQTVKIYNQSNAAPHAGGEEDWIVLEVAERLVDGRTRTTLTASNMTGLRWTPANVFATRLRNVIQSQRRVAATAGDTTIVSSVGAGGEATDHGTLTGLSDDDHPQYLLASGGRPLAGHMAVNAGITVDGVDISAHAADPSAHHAPVTAADTSITVSGQSIRIANAVAGDGLNLTGGVLSVKTSTALGTKIVTDVVGVDAWANGGLFNGADGLQVKLPTNSGLAKDSTGVYLAPSTLTAGTANALSGAGHTHAITATDNANTTTGALLKGSAVGYLTLAGLGVGDTATGAAAATLKAKAVDDYTLYMKQLSGQTASMLRVEATAGHALIILTGEGDLESGNPGFVSGMTGWQIESTGNAEFNNVSVRGELHAVTFVADEMHATGGTLAVMTATTVDDPVGANDNKLPALGATFTLNVTASYNTGLPYFATGDIIRIKHMGKVTSGAALDLYDIYLQVQTVGALTGDDLTEGEPGYHPLTCYRRNGGATNLVIPAGAAVVRWGKVSAGAGTYTGGIILTSDMAQSPYIDIFTIDANQTGTTWQTAPVTPTPRVRVGNLDGVLGLSEQWGLAAGVDLTDTNVITQKYIVASSAGLQLRNIDLKIYGAASPTIEMSNTGDVSFGTDINSDATTSFRHYPLNGALRIGPLVSGKPNLYWDGTDLHLRQHTTPVISLEASGASYFAGIMTIGTSGGIRQGTGAPGSTGTWSSPWGSYTGLRIGNDSGVGRLATYNAGTLQVQLDSAGKLLAGGGAVRLDSAGLAFAGATSSGGTSEIEWRTAGFGNQFGALNGYYTTGGTGFIELKSFNPSTGVNLGAVRLDTLSSGVSLLAYNGTTTDIILSAYYSGNLKNEVKINGELWVDGGIRAGYTLGTVNRGQLVSNFASEHNNNAVILMDVGIVSHGMTTIVDNATYGALGKFDNDVGGLQVQGYSESVGGLEILGHGGAQSTTKGTGALGGVTVTSRLKSGTGAGSHSANGNLFVVRNNTTTRLIVDAEGDLHIDGTSNTYDSFNDVALLRAADLALAGHDIDKEYGHWLEYNRADLERLGLVSAGGFVNVTRMQRVITGAIWQSYERIAAVEKRLGQAGL